MTLPSDEVLNVWGRKLLTDRGYNVSDDTPVSVELGTEGSGCCDDCYEQRPAIQLTCKGIWVTIDEYQFDKILLELVEISRKL